MAITEDRVFDAGLQLERTALAWQRTLLSLAAGSVAAGRALEPVLGPGALAVAALGVGTTVVMFFIARRRYVASHRHLTLTDEKSLPGEYISLVAAAVCILIAISALVFVLVRGI